PEIGSYLARLFGWQLAEREGSAIFVRILIGFVPVLVLGLVPVLKNIVVVVLALGWGVAIDDNSRILRGVSNTENGEVSGETVFHYEQMGARLTGTCHGGTIIAGHLLGTVNDDDTLDFVYHHINEGGEPLAGRCHSVPEIRPDGKLVLHES
ncbi:MAG: hypothetical protein ACOC1U_07030, partial [Spirochaetota bacterium]